MRVFLRINPPNTTLICMWIKVNISTKKRFARGKEIFFDSLITAVVARRRYFHCEKFTNTECSYRCNFQSSSCYNTFFGKNIRTILRGRAVASTVICIFQKSYRSAIHMLCTWRGWEANRERRLYTNCLLRRNDSPRSRTLTGCDNFFSFFFLRGDSLIRCSSGDEWD